MQQFKSALWVYLTHSYVTVLFITLTVGFFVYAQNVGGIIYVEEDKKFQFNLALNLTMMSFTGIYLAGALIKMKQYYLWQLNSKYRNSLLNAFLFLSIFLTILLLPFKVATLKQIFLSGLITFCITFYSAYIVVGKNKFFQFGIPAIPMLIYKLYDLGVHEFIASILLLAVTIGLIVFLYLDREPVKKMPGLIMTPAITDQGMSNPTIIVKINEWLGQIMIHRVLSNKAELSWAIISPYIKMGVPPLINVLAVALFSLIMNDEKFPYEAMLSMFFVTTLLSVILDGRNNFHQTKKIAHIFAGDRHRYLKNQMLFTIDKMMVFTTVIYLVATIAVISLFGINVLEADFLLSIPGILAITLAYHPIMLGIKWYSVTFKLVLVTLVYILMLGMTTLWIALSLIKTVSMIEITVFVFICVLLRNFAESQFSSKPVEEILRK